ncbi:MAG: hypothetical protein VKK07_06715 [Merismopediaceae bacterium]|nr:hypothetical protein [Merismopediaceae bacterium]
MSFQEAVKQTPLLKDHLKQGLQALGSHSKQVKLNSSRLCEGSVDIDQALERLFPQANRWDYALGYDGKTYFIEVHPADTSEVETLLKKYQWLKKFLREKAPQLNQEPKEFHWIASGGVHILPSSRQARKLAESKIKLPTRQLTLS